METFSAITFEIYFNGAWTDVSADVRATPHPRINGIGIMGDGFADHVGEPGTCEFSLDNSSANSAATQGYYTPTSITSPTKVVPGCPVRVSFTWDGYKRYKFYGTIDNDGVQVETGKYRGRSVKIKASNWFAIAVRTKLELMDYYTSLRPDQAIQNVLDKMTIKPDKITMSKSATTFSSVFDVTKTDTMAIGEINKLTLSSLDYAFMRGGELSGGEFVFLSRADLASKTFSVYPDKNSSFTDSILNETGGTDDILLETGDRLLLEHSLSPTWTQFIYPDNMQDLQIEYGTNMINRFRFNTAPRSEDAAAVVLWASETPITILAGETLTNIRGNYTDPGAGNSPVGGKNMVTPVATTDYQMFANSDGTGTDRTADLVVTAKYGTADVQYTLTNNNAATSYVTKLQARGIGIYTYDKQEKIFDSTTQQALYGVLEESVDMPYLDGTTTLFDNTGKTDFGFFGAGGLGIAWAYPDISINRVTFTVNSDYRLTAAFMFLEPTDQIQIYETMTANTKNVNNSAIWSDTYAVMGYDIEILPGKIVKWSPTLKRTGKL